MSKPVHGGFPAVVESIFKLFREVFDGFLLWEGQHKSLAQVANVVKRPQFREASGQHHDKQVNQKGTFATED